MGIIAPPVTCYPVWELYAEVSVDDSHTFDSETILVFSIEANAEILVEALNRASDDEDDRSIPSARAFVQKWNSELEYDYAWQVRKVYRDVDGFLGLRVCAGIDDAYKQLQEMADNWLSV